MRRQDEWHPREGGHQCEMDTLCGAYGEAIGYVYEDGAGHFWASNGEYASQVNYCPACGTRAPTQAQPAKQ